MKTILVFSLSSIMAHVIRPLEISKVLRQKGYRVIFAGQGKPLLLAQQVGFEVEPLPDLDEAGIAQALRDLRISPEAVHPIERVQQWVEGELALLREVRPVAVLDDARLTGGISTTLLGIPRITIMNAYISRYAVDGLLDPALSAPPSMLMAGAEVSYNQVRQRYGLAPISTALNLVEGDLNLLCDLPEYAPIADAPDNFHYVGPLPWTAVPERPSWLDRLDQQRPTLYFTMGSSGPEEAFQIALQAFADSPYQVVMTVGSRADIDHVLPAPSNFFVARYAPGDELMVMSDAVICHGGNGTTYQAILSGIPIITCPAIADQYWNARRQRQLGLGLTVFVLTPEALRAAVAEVLGKPDYRMAVQRFQRLLAHYDGPATAAGLIDKYLTGLTR